MGKKIKKQTTLSLNEKMELIEFVINHPDTSHTRVAEIFTEKFSKNVCRRSIREYLKNKEKIQLACSSNSNSKNCAKKIKFELLDRKLMEWIGLVESQGGFYNDKILKQQAIKYALEDNIVDFKSSNGWLYKFKLRNKIGQRIICGESEGVSKDDYKNFYIEINKKMKEYSDKDIFNCDETSLFYKLMPSKSLCSKIRKGCKNYKDRLSLLLCCNKDGSEKLTPLIIGKYKTPRALKTFNFNFYCEYAANDSAWMTISLFNRFLINFDLKMKKEKRKILLIFDNCPSHKITYEAKNIECVFLPKNSTFISQPLDMGIIRSFKTKFYHYQMSNIVSRITKETHAAQIYKKLDLKDAILFTRWAWDDVIASTIVNCWRKAGYYDELKDEKEILKYNIDNNEESIKELIKEIENNDPIDCNELLDLEFDENKLIVENVCNSLNKKAELDKYADFDEKMDENINFKAFETEEEYDIEKSFSIADIIQQHQNVKEYIMKTTLFSDEFEKDICIFESLKVIEKYLLNKKKEMKISKITDFLIKK
jgi:hypothetical protein